MDESSIERVNTSAGRRPRTPRRRNEWLIVGGVLVVLAAALALAGRDVFPVPAEKPAADAKPQAADRPRRAAPEPSPVEPTHAEATIIDDDQTLWASPTDGPPLELANLPPGVQIILAVRPAALLAHPEGKKVLAALGPIGADAVAFVEKSTGKPLRNIDQLLVGWQVDRAGNWDVTLIDTKAAGPAPPLTRDMERLVAHTDSSRHVTLLLRPRFLFGDGNEVFSGQFSRLRGPLSWFLGDGLAAVSLSVHWDENFFIELLAVPTLDSSPERTSEELAQRVSGLPDRVEEYVLGLDTSAYGRRVVARLPEMVRKLAAYTRHGFDKDCAVLRCYLPAIAGHNLLMGAELALAEGQGDKNHTNGPLAEASSPAAVAERLCKRTSLRFARETLEAALRMLSEDIGVAIIVRGQDLQLDGVTRNQMLGIDVADTPADEILVEILRLANPDKKSTGPNDPRQKLVYVIGPREMGGPEAVIITTRVKAEERGDRLPQAFVLESRQ